MSDEPHGPNEYGWLAGHSTLPEAIAGLSRSAVRATPAPPAAVCPYCELPSVLPEVCTPEIHAVIEKNIARDWTLFEAGRAHDAAVSGPEPSRDKEGVGEMADPLTDAHQLKRLIYAIMSHGADAAGRLSHYNEKAADCLMADVRALAEFVGSGQLDAVLLAQVPRDEPQGAPCETTTILASNSTTGSQIPGGVISGAGYVADTIPSSTTIPAGTADAAARHSEPAVPRDALPAEPPVCPVHGVMRHVKTDWVCDRCPDPLAPAVDALPAEPPTTKNDEDDHARGDGQ